MSLFLTNLSKSSSIAQFGRYTNVCRRFAIATTGNREVELKYLEKESQGVAVLGLNRPVAKNAFSTLSSSHRNYSSDANTKVEVQYLTGDNAGIAVIGLNKPFRKNALDRLMVSKLAEAANKFVHDHKTRVVIVRSLVPDVFCSGADLIERATFTVPDLLKYYADTRGALLTLDQLAMPVIAAVDGPAVGGGLEVALACDFIVASNDSKIGLIETSRAIFAGAGGSQRLSRRIGNALAKELIFTARVVPGTEAKELGICNHVVPQNGNKDAAYHKALEIAREMMPNGPIGIKMAKKSVNRGSEVDLLTGLSIEESCYNQTIHTKDRQEGMKAFGEKRKPNYIGE